MQNSYSDLFQDGFKIFMVNFGFHSKDDLVKFLTEKKLTRDYFYAKSITKNDLNELVIDKQIYLLQLLNLKVFYAFFIENVDDIVIGNLKTNLHCINSLYNKVKPELLTFKDLGKFAKQSLRETISSLKEQAKELAKERSDNNEINSEDLMELVMELVEGTLADPTSKIYPMYLDIEHLLNTGFLEIREDFNNVYSELETNDLDGVKTSQFDYFCFNRILKIFEMVRDLCYYENRVNKEHKYNLDIIGESLE